MRVFFQHLVLFSKCWIRPYPPPWFLIAVVYCSGTLFKFSRIANMDSSSNLSSGFWKQWWENFQHRAFLGLGAAQARFKLQWIKSYTLWKSFRSSQWPLAWFELDKARHLEFHFEFLSAKVCCFSCRKDVCNFSTPVQTHNEGTGTEMIVVGWQEQVQRNSCSSESPTCLILSGQQKLPHEFSKTLLAHGTYEWPHNYPVSDGPLWRTNIPLLSTAEAQHSCLLCRPCGGRCSEWRQCLSLSRETVHPQRKAVEVSWGERVWEN